MTIAPIAELGGLNGVVPQAGAKQPSPKSDFKDAFKGATDSITTVAAGSQMIRTEGTGAKGTDSNSTQDTLKDTTQRAQDVSAVKADDARTNERQQADEAGRSDLSDTKMQDKPLDTKQEAALEKTADKLLKEAAKVLGISDDELAQLLSDLGLTASALLDPQNMNLLVANAMADGDMMSIVTDGALSDAVKTLNELVGAAVEEIKEIAPEIDETKLKDLFAEALDSADVARENAQSGASVADEFKTEAKAVAARDIDTEISYDPLSANDNDASADMTVNAADHTQENTSAEDAQSKQDGAETKRDDKRDFSEEIRAQESFTDRVPGETMTERFEEVTRPEAPQSYVTDPQELLEQVQGQIRSQVSKDMTSVDMMLHPASLGNVALRVASQNGQVTAQFTVQNENVHDVLQAQILILKQNLEQQGVKVEAVEVTVASHAFEENLEQGNNGEGEASEQERERLRRATHRINLGDYAGEGAEGLEDADEVTVEMMQADGQRLNYRV